MELDARPEEDGGGDLVFDLTVPRYRVGPDQVIAALQRYGKRAPRPLTLQAFTGGRAGVSLAVVRRSFGSFQAACEAAGLDTHGQRRKFSDEELVSGFEDVCRFRMRRGLPGTPVTTDFDMHRRQTGKGIRQSVLTQRFGGYRRFLKLYDQYHKGRIDRAELVKRARAGNARRLPRDRLTARVYADTLMRFDYRCQACGRRACDLDPGERLEIDHIVPVAIGGTNEPENLTVKCSRDNRGKGARFVG